MSYSVQPSCAIPQSDITSSSRLGHFLRDYILEVCPRLNILDFCCYCPALAVLVWFKVILFFGGI